MFGSSSRPPFESLTSQYKMQISFLTTPTASLPTPPKLSIELIAAAGDVAKIQQLVSQSGISISARCPINYTPLLNAVYTNQLETVKYLINHGAVQKTSDNDFFMLICIALTKGYKDITILLLQNARTITTTEMYKNTILHFAVISGNTDVLSVILAHPHILHIIGCINSDQQTPLQLAEAMGNENAIKLINAVIEKTFIEPVSNFFPPIQVQAPAAEKLTSAPLRSTYRF